MGTDKAFLEIDGRPIARRTLEVLRDAGASECLAVGGDTQALEEVGFVTVADDHPGAGPLGGVLTGLRTATCELAVVLACDQPALGASIVTALVERLRAAEHVEAVIPLVEGRRQVLAAAYRTSVVATLRSAFDVGERSMQRAVERLAILEVDDLDPSDFLDLDRPEDLHRYHLLGSAGLPASDPVNPAEG